jgi:very-short-patch-repair endonuclease
MSALEDTLAWQLRVAGLPLPEREYRFTHRRRWRFDFAWVQQRVAVECEGGIYSGGRHVRGAGFEADIDKYNAAVSSGWKVLRFTSRHIKSGKALNMIEAVLAGEAFEDWAFG